MYLILFLILILFTFLVIRNYNQEGFDSLVDVLPIQISSDNQTITIPNQVKGNRGDDLTFGGKITFPTGNLQTVNANQTTFGRMTVNGDSQLKQTTIQGQTRILGNNLLELGADTGKSWNGNGSISYRTSWDTNALNIVGAENGGPRKVHLWDDVEIASNLQVNGSIKLGNGNNVWTIRTRDNGWLEFLYNNTSPDNYGANVGHILMSPDGNLWLARSSYPGWVADNLQTINNK